MRICLISREYPPDTGWGGIGAYTYQHARALKELGHDVQVVSLTSREARLDSASQAEPNDPLYVPVHRASWNFLFEDLSTLWISLPYALFALKSSLALWRKFLHLHTANPFDVVEAPEHLGEALFEAITGVCPLVVRLHTPHSKFIQEGYHNLTASFDQQLVAILERVAMLQADLLSSPSRDLAQYVAKDTGVALDAIEIVPNPVDCQKFCPDGERAIAADGRVTVFFAGRLEERKGVHQLVAAIPQVLSQCPKVRFVILGADTQTGPGKTSVQNHLRETLAATGSLAAVQFINHVALDQMAAHYRSADICVVPSLYENAPYTVLEAQACGKPVVGTDAGGSKEYIRHGSTGLVVPVKDAAALARAIIELVHDEPRRLAMGEAARALSLKEFDKKVIVSQAIATYAAAIERHRLKRIDSLYRYSPEQSLTDFVTLLYGYHLNLCDLIYRHSFVYRLKSWWQLALKRPRLCAAKTVLGIIGPVISFLKISSPALERMAANISAQVAEREQERARMFLEALLKSCQIEAVQSEQQSALSELPVRI